MRLSMCHLVFVFYFEMEIQIIYVVSLTHGFYSYGNKYLFVQKFGS